VSQLLGSKLGIRLISKECQFRNTLGNKRILVTFATKKVVLCRSWGIRWGIGNKGLLFPNYPDFSPARAVCSHLDDDDKGNYSTISLDDDDDYEVHVDFACTRGITILFISFPQSRDQFCCASIRMRKSCSDPSCGTNNKAMFVPQQGKKKQKKDSIPLNVQPNMNETTNVLVQYQLLDLSKRSETNFWLALICLAVCAINMVLMYLNWVLNNSKKPVAVENRTFHMIEFWTSFVYAIAEACALVTSPKTMLNIYSKPLILKLLLFFNVVASLVPAILITLDTEYFERTAHELEFINEFTISFITLILLVSLLKQDEEGAGFDFSPVVLGLLGCGVAATTFTVYNLSMEEYAHYLEFAFNIATSMVTFWFCMDNRFVAEMEAGQILYGEHKNCNLCKTRVSDYNEYQRTSTRWQTLYGDGGSSERGGGGIGEEAALLLSSIVTA
jgi:hypothetical protein